MSDNTISRLKEVANANPVTFLEQGWSELIDIDTPEIEALYHHVAKTDPTNTARLVTTFANRPYAKDVLITAFETFPSAAWTYPEWKGLPFAHEVEKVLGAPKRWGHIIKQMQTRVMPQESVAILK